MRSNTLFFRLWGIPLLLGIITLVGLLSALIDDGYWDVLSWIMLGIPFAVMGFHLRNAK